MATTRFDRSKLNAFVQSSCFARNNPAHGFRIFCGSKKWRGMVRWPRFFADQPLPNQALGNTVYLGIKANLLAIGGGYVQNYHGVDDKFGNGPPKPLVDPITGVTDYTLGYIDDGGSDPALGTAAGVGSGFPFPTGYQGVSGYLDQLGIVYGDVTIGDTFYEVRKYTPPNSGAPPPPGLGWTQTHDFEYTLSIPYVDSEALNDAIAVARGGSNIGVGFTKTGIYQEESGTFDAIGGSPFARAPYANGASMWWAGWNLQGLATTQIVRPWSGAQLHTAARKLVDGGVPMNFDQTVIPGVTPNPHKAYLVSRCNRVFDTDFPNVIRVVCSTFSGSGALATYEESQSGRTRPIPRKISCVDIVANNLALDPTFPSLPIPGALQSGARWQIFFPGKKASEIPDPNLIWNP